MDEKLLEEIRRQEEAFIEQENLAEDVLSDSDEEETLPPQEEVVPEVEALTETQDIPDTDSGETKQTTLFGGDY